MEEIKNWHSLEKEEVIKILKTDPKRGLDEEEVLRRQREVGKNLLPEEKPLKGFRLFLAQFKSPLIYILLFAGAITLILGETADGIVILSAVFINAIFGFWEENKVSRVLEKLKKVLKAKAVVIRQGRKKEVFQEELVPGDIIILKPGDRVPADGRLIEVENLKISEAVLTGEWLPAEKEIIVLPEKTSLADRDNMVFMGGLVESGTGKAVVVATGIKTESGKIALLVKHTKEEKTPLQEKLTRFSKKVGIAIGIICILIFLIGTLREGHPLEMFETAVAIAVGGIPEALPITMVLILAIGMQRIFKKNGLVRRLSSVETLGSAEIICFDKTRTLTQGKMVLAEIVGKDRKAILKGAVISSEGFVENENDPIEAWNIKGSATDRALIWAGLKEGILKPQLEKEKPELARLPFDSSYKYTASLRKETNGIGIYVCGAPERVLENALEKERKNWILKIEELTNRGLRVVGVGYKKLQKKINPENIEWPQVVKDYHFLGLIALKDPIRKGVERSIRICQEAGMRPILVTGDHRLTAKTIAQEIGLRVREENILEGKDIDNLSDQELSERLEKIKIFARVEPRHKLKIVSLWQKKGKVVAMTGDGVNDAPALKKADIGIALGSGTEAAKEAADLVLLDDSFEAIIEAIKEGRAVLDNLRKAIAYILSDSFASAILITFTKIIFGWPLPILPVQILWNNIVEDTLPDIAYAFEPEEKGIMRRKPNPRHVPLLTKEMKILIFATGLIDEFLRILLFWYFWRHHQLDLSYVRTIVFGSLCIDTAFVVFCYKNLRKNIWKINIFSNKWLVIASITVFLFFAFAIYFPPLQQLLGTVPLGVNEWLLFVGVGILSMSLIEITKWYFISRHLTEE